MSGGLSAAMDAGIAGEGLTLLRDNHYAPCWPYQEAQIQFGTIISVCKLLARVAFVHAGLIFRPCPPLRHECGPSSGVRAEIGVRGGRVREQPPIAELSKNSTIPPGIHAIAIGYSTAA